MLLARPNHLDLVYVENKALPPEILNRLLRIGAFQDPSLLARRLSEDPAKTHGKVFGAVVALVVKFPPGSGCRASRIIGEPSTLVILAGGLWRLRTSLFPRPTAHSASRLNVTPE